MSEKHICANCTKPVFKGTVHQVLPNNWCKILTLEESYKLVYGASNA